MDSKEYRKALEELEEIAVKVEDPQTDIEEIDRCLDRSKAIIAACREFLRGAREKAGEDSL